MLCFLHTLALGLLLPGFLVVAEICNPFDRQIRCHDVICEVLHVSQEVKFAFNAVPAEIHKAHLAPEAAEKSGRVRRRNESLEETTIRKTAMPRVGEKYVLRVKTCCVGENSLESFTQRV